MKDELKPKRIQRKRTKGWRMPPNTVYVGRPTKWGNPYIAENPGEFAEVIENYQAWMDVLISRELNHDFAELRGKNLVCWCPLNRPCHADILLKLANAKVRNG